MPPKENWEKYTAPIEEEETEEEKKVVPLSEGDIQVLKTYVCIPTLLFSKFRHPNFREAVLARTHYIYKKQSLLTLYLLFHRVLLHMPTN